MLFSQFASHIYNKLCIYYFITGFRFIFGALAIFSLATGGSSTMASSGIGMHINWLALANLLIIC